jgi:peroxiredoxin
MYLVADRERVLFFCGCVACRETAKQLDSPTGPVADAAIWGISDPNPADVRYYARETRVRFPLASDANSRIRQVNVPALEPIVVPQEKGYFDACAVAAAACNDNGTRYP